MTPGQWFTTARYSPFEVLLVLGSLKAIEQALSLFN